jgi:hypothetical protein
MAIFNIIVGWTSPIDIDLKDDGATPSGTLAGTVTLVMQDKNGTAVTFTGNVAIQNATTWRVRMPQTLQPLGYTEAESKLLMTVVK